MQQAATTKKKHHISLRPLAYAALAADLSLVPRVWMNATFDAALSPDIASIASGDRVSRRKEVVDWRCIEFWNTTRPMQTASAHPVVLRKECAVVAVPMSV